VDLVNTYDGPEMGTCFSIGNGVNTACQEFTDWELGVFETGQQPLVYLEHKLSETNARLRADFTPSYDGITNSSQTVYNSSYVLTLIADDDTGGSGVVNASGLVRITPGLTSYLDSLPFCWTKSDIWAEYVNAVSIPALYSMTPCKTYQKGRDNFVFLHAANITTDTEDVYKTILAIYKTPAGRDRVADVQNGNNLLLVAMSIDAILFNSVDIQDTAMPLVYDFTLKAFAHWPVSNNLVSWTAFAETFSRAQYFDKTIVIPASKNPLRPDGLLGLFNAALNASISFDLPASHNAVKVRFANAVQSGNVMISVCRTRKQLQTCSNRASTNAIFFDDVEFSSRYALGDRLVVYENGGAIGQNLQISLSKISRLLRADTSKNEAVYTYAQDRVLAMVPGRAQLAILANRESLPIYTITGTFFGSFVGVDIADRIAWKLRGDIYVFWIQQSYIKMTSVTLSAALNSATPVSPGDRYTSSTSSPVPSTVAMLQDMWDGTLPGNPTTLIGENNRYDVKNVRVLCSGQCRNNFDNKDGPDGRGAVFFDRSLSQFLDGGIHTFNIASNGGFTAVAVVKFTGIAGSFERIFDFGDGGRARNILMGRDGTSTSLYVAILDEGVVDCSARLSNVIMQNTWITVIAAYRSSDKTLQLRVGSDFISTVCATARLDRVFSTTYVGRSNRAADAYFSGSIAGVHLVDELLDEAKIWQIVDRIFQGIDTVLDLPADTYMQDSNADSDSIDEFTDLLLRQKPYIVSDAADWNAQTKRFDSKCGVQTCAGNTGSLTTGEVTSGMIAGNGARVPIAFVGGDTNSELDWGVGGIPNTFTVCSITRYSGTNKNRVLTGYSSATSNKFGVIDWLQGHVYGMTGVFYSTDTWHGRDNLLSPTTEWVVACWRNLDVSGKIITTINGNTISTVAGGKAPIALGINKIPAEKSDWQLSKLYIWDYHLSDVDFALASSSLYAALSTNMTAGVHGGVKLNFSEAEADCV